MDLESFTALALRVLAGEGSDADRRVLERELTAVPARREEFEQLKLTLEILRATAPMTEAARATAPGLPAHRVNELRTAVRQHFGPAKRAAKAGSRGWIFVLRWIFGGSGVAALGFAVIVLLLANREVEIGLYTVDRMRGGEQGLASDNVPAASLVTFDYDAQFEAWQRRPLAWNEHAKIWVDNEHDLLYIVRRVRYGEVVTETHPLAPTDEGQHAQIEQAVDSLKK
jgi:hypothetical protein